jgi:hypothetical protein
MLAFVLKALPYVLKFVNLVLEHASDRRMLRAGRTEAISEQLERISRTVAMARATEAAASASHARDRTDGAFDQEFRRED